MEVRNTQMDRIDSKFSMNDNEEMVALKKHTKRRENEFSKDRAILSQRIDILQMELSESKDRE